MISCAAEISNIDFIMQEIGNMGERSLEKEMIMDYQISNALLAAYTGVFYIDLVNDTFIPAKKQDQVYHLIKDINSAQEAITTAIKKKYSQNTLRRCFALLI